MSARKLIVRIIAWCMRPNRHEHPRLYLSDIDSAMRKSFPHRDIEWRHDIYQDARIYNSTRESRKKA